MVIHCSLNKTTKSQRKRHPHPCCSSRMLFRPLSYFSESCWQDFTDHFSCWEISCCGIAGIWRLFRLMQIMFDLIDLEWLPQVVNSSENRHWWIQGVAAIDKSIFISITSYLCSRWRAAGDMDLNKSFPVRNSLFRLSWLHVLHIM